MIELMNLAIDTQPPLPDGTAVVHPFYRASFLKLSGLTEGEVVVSETAYPHENEDFLIPILRAASVGYEKEITRFYDVRTTEEYGQAAPQYALLAGTGLRQVSPLSVKGRQAFPFALELAREPLENGETVLFCCAELYTPMDRPRGKCREACAFLLRKRNPEDALEGRTYLLEHRCNAPKEEALVAVERENAALVCSDDREIGLLWKDRHVEMVGLVQPFARLLQAQGMTQMLVVSHDGDRYNYFHIRKGG